VGVCGAADERTGFRVEERKRERDVGFAGAFAGERVIGYVVGGFTFHEGTFWGGYDGAVAEVEDW
jgi:hypothetical protein